MSVAVKQPINYEAKFAHLSKETQNAAGLFISFCELEKDHRQHPVAMQRSNFIWWIKKQEAKYYNAFITRFAAEMHWENQEFTLTKEPPKMFLILRQAAQSTEKAVNLCQG